MARTRFAQWFTEQRKARGLTLHELADKLGYSYDCTRVLGSGRRAPDALQLQCAIDVFGQPPFHVEPRVRKRPGELRAEIVAMIESGTTLTKTAANLQYRRSVVYREWYNHCKALGLPHGSGFGWTGQQGRYMLEWVDAGHSWQSIAQRLGRSVEDCRLHFDQISAQVSAAE